MSSSLKSILPSKVTLNGKRWQYRGEGNANLVLAVPNERKVFRFHKTYFVDGKCEEEVEEKIFLQALFCQEVMGPLVGKCFIQSPTVAYIETTEVNTLNEILYKQRPVHRLHKGLHSGHVAVYPDFTLLPLHLSYSKYPTFCVEIKPKQGWIPIPDRRIGKCLYCLNQYLKLKEGTIQYQSQFCPLDLFSGDCVRMKTALKALLAAPQNNLRIFQDGNLVYGEEMRETLDQVLNNWFGDSTHVNDSNKLLNMFCFIVLEALTRNFDLVHTVGLDMHNCNELSLTSHEDFVERIPHYLITTVASLLSTKPCNWLSGTLPPFCILSRIQHVQALEQCGADSVYTAYKQNLCNTNPDDYLYVKRLVSTGVSSNLSLIERYLLSTTARDCSIAMAFQRIPCEIDCDVSSCHVIHVSEKQSFVFNIGALDLDPKPMSCIEKHRKRDTEILKACLEALT